MIGVKLLAAALLLCGSTLVDAAPSHHLAARDGPDGTNATESTDKYRHAGLNLRLNPAFNASGDWLTKSCDGRYRPRRSRIRIVDPGPDPDFADDSTLSGVDQWKKADADTALKQLIAAWNTRPSNPAGDWTFSHFVWASFAQSGGLGRGPWTDCGQVEDENCFKVTCDASKGVKPAAYLIMQSMVTLRSIFKMQYDGLNQAMDWTRDDMRTVSDTFDPKKAPNKDAEIVKTVFGFLMTALGAVSGGTISSAFSTITTLGKITDEAAKTMKTVANTGLSLTSDILNIPPPKDPSDMSEYLGVIQQNARNNLNVGITSMLDVLTNANGMENQTLMTNIMSTGLLLDFYNHNAATTDKVKKSFITMLYAQTIPAAWRLSAEGFRPFILRMDAKDSKCNDDLPKDIAGYFDKDVAPNARYCDEAGNSYWLLNGVYKNQCTQLDQNLCGDGNYKPFAMLPGGDIHTLNGTDWGGLRFGDIIKSAWGGFMANNKQNGYGIPKGTDQQVAANMTLQGSNGLPMAGGVLTPGFFSYTICLDYKEAVKNLKAGKKDVPICGTSPAPGNSITDMNGPGKYTPGWCTLHATQYQRGEGNLNPLDVYQVAVKMYDGARIQIGGGVKQAAGSPLDIPSSLPYRFTVAPTGGDEAPLSFWYGDQYWTSDDKEHQCSQGVFDGGKREIDCGFQCPLPAADPPASATKDHPLPGAPTPAVADASTYVNNYITLSPPPSQSTPAPPPGAPPAKPTPTYATGQCGVHVHQWQKNLKGVNPSNDYLVETTIFDGKQKPIGSSGQVPARDGTAVLVTGLLDPFKVTAFGPDDSLRFDFNADSWWSNSSRCSVGRYDDGARDMDCGFAC